MSDACRHISPGQPAPHIAHDVDGSDWRVCTNCYLFARWASRDINDVLRLYGMREPA